MANVLPENVCPETTSAKEKLRELVKAGCTSMSIASMVKLTGINAYHVSAYRRGEVPALSLERLIAICRKLGHTVTIKVGED